MPIRWKIEPELQVVTAACTGVVTADEIETVCAEWLRTPGFDATFDVLSDLRSVTELRLSPAELRRLAQSYPLAQAARQAIVVTDADARATAVAFSAMVAAPSKIRVFADMTNALIWLAEPA